MSRRAIRNMNTLIQPSPASSGVLSGGTPTPEGEFGGDSPGAHLEPGMQMRGCGLTHDVTEPQFW
ncbi:hypothetical protein DV515_00016470 [Chloebia gouldiae]|uniref:Uncharacterized protein n=1 Tax=Chloebia gouldiae TaxID=44316 RepID=A0A3L8RRZ4_CHLGU|nr:hypothetical protein DV515_00016470 [Chloebia gouldiae]